MPRLWVPSVVSRERNYERNGGLNRKQRERHEFFFLLKSCLSNEIHT